MITRLVLSGGGPAGFATLGALFELEKCGELIASQIESVHGTSCGAVIGACVAMGYDIGSLFDYFVKRPWHETPIPRNSLLATWEKGGLLDVRAISLAIKPLIEAKGGTTDMTLSEFHDKFGKEVSVYATDITGHTFDSVKLHRSTHGHTTISEALTASCAIPGLFAPVSIGDQVLVDGFLTQNFPLDSCIDADGCEPGVVLAVDLYTGMTKSMADGKPSSSLPDIMARIALCSAGTLSRKSPQAHSSSAKVILCNAELDGISSFHKVWKDEEERNRLVEIGASAARSYVLDVTNSRRE